MLLAGSPQGNAGLRRLCPSLAPATTTRTDGKSSAQAARTTAQPREGHAQSAESTQCLTKGHEGMRLSTCAEEKAAKPGFVPQDNQPRTYSHEAIPIQEPRSITLCAMYRAACPESSRLETAASQISSTSCQLPCCSFRRHSTLSVRVPSYPPFVDVRATRLPIRFLLRVPSHCTTRPYSRATPQRKHWWWWPVNRVLADTCLG